MYCLLFWILAPILVYWLLMSAFAYYNVKKIIRYYRVKPDIEMKKEWEPLIGLDADKWDEKALIKGCFWKFPKNVFFLGSFLVGFGPMVLITKPFG
jgi:hypothetical protein